MTVAPSSTPTTTAPPDLVQTVARSAHELAIDYIRRGWPVLPVHWCRFTGAGMQCSCWKDGCNRAGKHPMTPNGLNDATFDEVLASKWFDVPYHAPNVGIRTGLAGEGSGFIALDIDPKHDGHDTLAELVAEHGPLPPTPTTRTGSGGAHHLFEHPGKGTVIKNHTSLFKGIDVRGDNGYIVVPPSRHKSGGEYIWEPGLTPCDVPLAPIPYWLLAAMEERGSGSRKGPSASRSYAPRTSPADGSAGKVAEGGRNAHLMSIGGTLRRRDCGEEVVLAALVAENKTACEPPLDDAEVQLIVRSVCRYSASASTIGNENMVRQNIAAPTEAGVVATWEMTGTTEALAQLEATWTKGDAPTTTGLKNFDELLGGGLRAGDVIALAGAAGSSKSALAGSVAYDAAHAGAVVLIASVEMPPAEVHARWVALELFRQAPPHAWAVRFSDVFRGRAHRGECASDPAASAEIRRRLDAAIVAVKAHTTVYVKHVPPGTTPSMLNIFMKKLREKHPDKPALLIVDPVQRLYASESMKRRGRALDSINGAETERVGAVAQELKHMADSENFAVIFTSDTTKSAVLNNTSSSTSLRGSYELNHLATTVLGVYSGETPEAVHQKLQAGDVSKPLTTAEITSALPAWWGSRSDAAQLGARVVALECSKNRQGPQRSFALGFIGGAMAFVERDPSAAAAPPTASRIRSVRRTGR